MHPVQPRDVGKTRTTRDQLAVVVTAIL